MCIIHNVTPDYSSEAVLESINVTEASGEIWELCPEHYFHWSHQAQISR